MTTSSNGSGRSGTPESTDDLEAAIRERRDHLASTIDELSARAKPKEVLRRGVASARSRLLALTHTPDGELRTERLAAVAAALAVLGGAIVVRRRSGRGD